MSDTKRTIHFEAVLWLAVTAVAILLSVVLLVRNAGQRTDLQSMQSKNEVLATQVTDLQARCEEYEKRAQDQPGLTPWDVDEFKKKGLAHPTADLVTDLQKHPGLIPHKGVLGGTMAFAFPEKIHVLTDKYALAYFEDGHIAGWMLLEYAVSKRGEIDWRVIDSYLD